MTTATITEKELKALIKAVEEPLYWDCRGTDEEYKAFRKAIAAFNKIKKLLPKPPKRVAVKTKTKTKPKSKVKPIQVLDYHECEQVVEEKLGYELRDTLGKFDPTRPGNKNVPYRDFWHFLVDTCGVTNGGTLYMPFEHEAKEEWQKEILRAFHTEFGEGPYLTSW